jgi:pimeloyl-ACP methyl ester carboxylesterase
MPETINLELRGGDFHAEIATGGNGPPLLYLHGAVGQKGWAPFLERLSQQFTVYAPHLPGYGEATGLEHLADLTDLTLYHLELLDALGVDRAHVVGHFLGGMIAAEMSAFSPSCVNRLALVSPAGVWHDKEPVADLLALNADELKDRMAATPGDASSLDGFADMLARDRMQDIAAAGKFLWPLPDKGLSRRAYRIKAPTLILWGEQDRINPPSYASDFQGMIAGSKTGTIPNAGHLLMLEQPDAFADTVAAFLNEGH